MANEIIFDNSAYSALVVYATVKNSVGQIYAGTTPETPQNANWTTYPVTMTEAGTTGIFRGTFPVLAAGVYPVTIRQRVGGTAAVTDPVVGDGQMNWNGTAEVLPLSATTAGRTLDVSATGEAGLDFDNIKDATGAHTLTNIRVPSVTLTDTTTTLTNAPSDSSGVTTLLTRLTALRAGYLDNLSAGAVALEESLQTAIGYIDTEITTIINRIGAFTGTGVNTVLGFLKALASKTATTPSDIGGTFDPATDSLEAVEDNTPAGVWAYATRTLTSSGNAATTVSGSAVSVYRGTTWSIAFTSLGNITGYSKIWLTVKDSVQDSDAQAIVQIEKTAGLTVLNGSSSVTAGDGAIAVSSESLGNLTVTLKPASSSQVAPDKNLSYDVKVLIGTTVSTLVDGRNLFQVISDVTRTYA